MYEHQSSPMFFLLVPQAFLELVFILNFEIDQHFNSQISILLQIKISFDTKVLYPDLWSCIYIKFREVVGLGRWDLTYPATRETGNGEITCISTLHLTSCLIGTKMYILSTLKRVCNLPYLTNQSTKYWLVLLINQTSLY